MFFNILFKLFLLGLCLGEKKETVSSISFRRHDVSLPKYNSIQDYLKETPKEDKDHLIDYFRHRPNILKSIQYAPLNLEERSIFDRSDINNPSKHQIIETKVHLEPRLVGNSNNNDQVTQANFLQFIEGHNIVPLNKDKDNRYGDVLPEKNKEMDQTGYGISLSHKQENSENQKDLVSLKATTKASSHFDTNNQQTLSTKEYQTKSIQVLSALENSQIEPVFNSYVKVPRLHLNIARAYNFARFPLKASLIGYQKLLSNKPKQAFVPNIDVLLQEKTFLYPDDSNKYTLRT